MNTAAREAESHSIAVFPFLKTTEKVYLADVAIRPMDDIDGLTAGDAQKIAEISAMFFLQDDLRIASPSYALLPSIDLDRPGTALEKLRRIRDVIAYCYSIPHHIFGEPHLRYEHASVAVFSPGRVSTFLVRPEHGAAAGSQGGLLEDERGEIAGYAGLYNFKHHFWVAKGSRLYPPVPQIVLNISQNLAVDFADFFHARRFELLPELASEEPTGGMAERALTSLAWFNEANSLAAADELAIVNLAIAFESLFGLPEDQKSKRLVDSVALVLGRIPRLDEWARQFYEARSKIVHEGKAPELRFRVGESGKSAHSLYNSLLSYGRHVFHLCVATLLFGARLARSAGLEEKLVTNRERFEQISRLLSDESVSPEGRFREIASTVDAAALYRSVGESSFPISVVMDAVRLAAKTLLTCEAKLERQVQTACEKLATAAQGPDFSEVLAALREFHEIADRTAITGDALSPWVVTTRLLDVSWDYAMWHYFARKRAKTAETAESGGRDS